MSADFAVQVRELQATVSKMQATLEAIGDAIFWIGHDGVVQWCNASGDRLMPHPLSGLAGAQFTAVLPLMQLGQPIATPSYPHLRLLAGEYTPTEYELAREGDRLILQISGNCLDVGDGERIAVLVVRDVTPLRLLEAGQRWAEAKYQSIFDNATQGIFQTTPDGRCIAANPALARIFGVASSEQVMNSPRDMDGEVYLEPGRRRDFLRLLHENGVITNFESQVYREDGTVIWISETARVVRDEAGHPLYYEGFVEDITERKQAEQQREELLSMLRATVESTADGILVVTRDRNAPIYNQKFLQMWGIPESLMDVSQADQRLEFLSSRTKDPEAFLKRVWQLFRDRPEEEALELIELKDGRIFERYTQPQRIGDRIVGRVWSFRDITRRKRTEAALQQQAAAIKASIDGIAVLDRNETYLYLNESYAKIYGYGSAQELIGKPWRTLYDHAELLRFEQDMMPEFVRTGHWRGEATGRRRNGSKFAQELTLSKIHDGGMVCIVRDITNRKQAEQALRSQELRLRLALDAAQMGAWESNELGQLRWSARAEAICGFAPGSFEGDRHVFLDLVHPDDREMVKQAILRSYREKIPYQAEYRLCRPDGELRWLAAWGAVYQLEPEQPWQMTGVVIDITERKRSEAALKASEAELRTLFGAMDDVILVFNREGRCLKVAPTKTNNFYKPPAANIHKTVYEILPKPQAELQLRCIRRALETQQTQSVEYSLSFPDGEHWFYANVASLSEDSVVFVSRDITNRKRTEEALQRSNAMLKAQQEASIDGILVLDENFRVVSFNQRLCQLWQLPETVLQERSNQGYLDWIRNQMEDPTTVVEHSQSLHRHPEAISRDEILLKDGRTFDRYSAPIQSLSGEQYGRIWYYRDITERKQAEEALRRSEFKFRHLFENSQVGIIRIQLKDGLILDANQRFVQLVGYDSAAQVIGQKSTADLYVDPTLRPWLVSQLEQHGEVNDFETQIWRQDGTTFWGLCSARLNLEEDCVDAVIADITDRKQAEEDLRQSETRFQALYESTSVAVILADEHGVIDCNCASTAMFGYSREEMRGKHPGDFSSKRQPNGEDSYTFAERQVKTAIRQGSHFFEWMHRRADGTEFPAEVWLTAVSLGDRQLLQAIVQDLTERKKLEVALAERANLAAFRAAVSGALAQSTDLSTMLQACAAAAVNHLNAAFTRIWMLNPDNQSLELRASAGLYTRLNGTHSRIQIGQYKIGLLAQTRQPFYTNNVQTDPRISDQAWAARKGLVAFAGHPLLLNDQLIGVIGMFSRQPITEQTFEALNFAASEIALGIRRKQTEEALENSLALLSATFESITDGIMASACDGKITSYNQNFVDMWSIPPEVLIKTEARIYHIAQQLKQPDGFVEGVRQLYATPDGETYDLLELKDGRIFERTTRPQRIGDRIIGRVWSFRDITDVEQAEKALKASEAKYRRLVENASEIIYALHPNGEIAFASPNVQNILGYDPTDLEGKPFMPLIHPDDLQGCLDALQRLLATGQRQSVIEYRILHKNGQWRWQTASIAAAEETTGQWMAIGVTRDITERKLAEEALRRSELKYRNIFENSQVGIYRTRLSDGLVMDGNQRFIQMLGYDSADEVIDKVLGATFYTHPEQRQHVLTQLEEQGELHNFEMQYRQRDGSLHWGLFSLRLNREENCLEGFMSCITDRKQAEAALQESEQRFRQLAENIQSVFWMTDLEKQQMLYVSPAYERIWGRSCQSLYAEPLSWLKAVHPEDRDRVIAARVKQQKGSYDEEYRIVRPDGQVRWIRDRAFPIRDTAGRVYRIAGIEEDITDRKQSEEALRRSELKFRGIFENSLFGIGRTRFEDGLFLDANQRCAELMGAKSAAELVGRCSTRDLYTNPEQRLHVLEQLRQHGEISNLELHMHRLDGSLSWILVSLRLNAEASCIEFFATDISDRKRLEEEFQQSQQFLDNIINHIPLAIFAKDITNDFRYVLVNRGSEKLLGFQRDNAIGLNDYDLIPRDRANQHRMEDLEVLARGEACETNEYWFEPQPNLRLLIRGWKIPIYGAHGEATHLLGITEDITERWQREQALRLIVEGTAAQTGDEFFHACVRYLAEVLQVRYALVTEFADAARTRARTLAIHGSGSVNRNFEYTLQDAPCCAKVLQGETCFHPENLQASFPQDSLMVNMNIASYMGMPLTDSMGQVLGHIAVMDDKPMQPDARRELILKIFADRAGAELERKQSEAALRIAKEAAEAANRAKSTFLANMSHELRTPLNAILGFAQLLERDTALTLRQRDFLSTINRSGEHLLNLINDVLEMSKIEAGRIVLNPAPFDLHRLLQTIREMFQLRTEAKQLCLRFELASNLPQYVITDEGKLRQVLINLLGNAVKFTDTGSITLRLQAGGCLEEGCTTFTLQFEVEDTGSGIAPAEVKQLFQPFVQTPSSSHSHEGTGLGLAISRQFVRLMGGDIDLTSQVGAGSTFRFYVQVKRAESADVAAALESRRVLSLVPDQPVYRILVVDDRAENRDPIAELLTCVGFETRTATNGEEAIAHWQSWQPHLIWMDMRMPVMDGYEATRQIRNRERGRAIATPTKILALTASAFEEERTHILAAGCDDLVSKPFQEQIIFDKMTQHLGVQYVYEQPRLQESTPQPDPTAPDFELNAVALQAMPPDWIRELNQAALAVDAEYVMRLIQQIPTSHSELGLAIAERVRQYDFDTLLELTEPLTQ